MSAGLATMFYCGCYRELGHYLWADDKTRLSWEQVRSDQPWGDAVDGALCPPKGTVNGVARLTHEHDWSALSWWDNSIDSRPGSHSTFIVRGTHTAEALLALARARFPWVFERFKYAIVVGAGTKQ